MELKFRELRADEVECRVNTINEKGCTLLLYKDARCDMRILDEVVGAMNWQRSHSRDNANCTVSIWDSERGIWVCKEDTGAESYTEKDKGLASDSFKRACFNFGIGRELYTAPFIWISAEAAGIKKGSNGKCSTYDKFVVDEMTVENGKIVHLVIANDTKNTVVFTWDYKVKVRNGNKAPAKTQPVSTNDIPNISPNAQPPVQNSGFVCKSCGKVINNVQKPDGTIVTAETVYKSCGGLCASCWQKANKTKQV